MELHHYILATVLLLIGSLIFYKAWVGIVVYYALAVIKPSVFLPELLSSFRLSLIVIILTVLSLFASCIKTGITTNNLRSLFPIALLAICALVNLSHLVSDLDSHTVYFGTHTPDEFVAEFNKRIFAFILALFLITRWPQIEYLLYTLLGVVVFFSVWVNFQHISNYMASEAIFSRIGGPVGGFLEDENNMAVLLVAGVAPAFFTFVYHKHPVIRLLSFAALLTILHGIFLTGSRGGFIALLAVVLFIASRFRLSKRSILFLTLFGLSVPLLGTTVIDRFGNTIEKHNRAEEYIDPRISTWTMGLEILKSNPWLGIGPGRFQQEVANYPLRENSPVGSCGVATPCVVHNTFLEISTSGGIFAGTLYILILIRVLIPGVFIHLGSTARKFRLFMSNNCSIKVYNLITSAERTRNANTSNIYDRSDFRFYSGEVIQASILGIAVCGLMLNLMLFEIFYFLVMLFIARVVLLEREATLLREVRYTPRRRRRIPNKWSVSTAKA